MFLEQDKKVLSDVFTMARIHTVTNAPENKAQLQALMGLEDMLIGKMNKANEELGFTEEQMSSQAVSSKGKVLIGTVEKDVHDIGKNIVKGLLVSNGYEVKDIGVDVTIDKFVEEVKNYSPQVVAMSGLLTIAYESMKKFIDSL